jgi:hypothetical protein
LKYKYDLIDGRTLTMALSNKQSKRLGAIISVVFEEDLPKGSEKELIGNGFIEANNKAIGYGYNITDKGLDEKNRLCTLAGLNIKYKSEIKDAIQTEKKETKEN